MKSGSRSNSARKAALPPAWIRQLRAHGHLAPGDEEGRAVYSRRDRLTLQIVHSLSTAKVSRADIEQILTRIEEVLPVQAAAPSATRPSSGAGTSEEPERGGRRGALSARRQQAEAHFQRALALEDSDAAAARAGYLAALNSWQDHLEARINLGRLLHLAGELQQSERVYRAARHASAVLSFNLATLLEDMQREAEAIDAYRSALALDPTLGEAHLNLSRLHERAERPREALHHLLAFRRHTLASSSNR